jgi:serine/threonine protein kinase
MVNPKTETSVSDQTKTLVVGDAGASSSSAGAPGTPDYSGKVIGGYQLVRMIAEGGMGVVYEGIQLNLSRKVAIKILNQELAARPEFVQRFQREAKAAAALSHPNMVQVHDFCQTADGCLLVMEFVEGQDLGSYVEDNGRISIATGLAIVEQAAQALKAASDKAIIHRDIKPSNLMMSRGGHVKVSDLGLAKMLNEASDLTLTGVGMGSPYFIAPEQASDARDVDQRVDIYSLGITLLYLLTGKRPFDGNTPFSVVLAHANKPLPTGAELGTELPDEIEALIQRMAAKNPDERYLNYDQLLTDLRRVRGGESPAYAPVRVTVRTTPGALKQIVSATIMAAVFGIGGFYLLQWKSHLAKSPSIVTPAATPAAVPAFAPPDASVVPRTGAPTPPQGNWAGGTPQLERPLRGQSYAGQRPPPRDDMQPPDDRGGQAERSGPSIQLPFGRLPRPEPNTIPDGPISTMLSEADTFATQHPNDFRPMVDRYRQVLDKAQGTEWERTVNDKLQAAVSRHQAALRQAMQDYQEKMIAQLRARNPQAAYDVWKDFPQNLRTFESDQEVADILERNLPHGFVSK